MTRILLLLLFITSTCQWSCSCQTEVQGVVLDAQTKQPVAGVMVQIYLSSIHGDTLQQYTTTDQQGQYTAAHAYCKNHMLDFYKLGYIGFVASAKDKDTIFLERDNF